MPGQDDPGAEAEACRAIDDALGDHNDELLRLSLGLAGDVQRRQLVEG